MPACADIDASRSRRYVLVATHTSGSDLAPICPERHGASSSCRTRSSAAVIVAMITTLAAPAFGQVFAAGAPAKMLASCEADLNGDKNADLVLQLETVRGPEVIALLTAGDTYRGFIIAKGSGAQFGSGANLATG